MLCFGICPSTFWVLHLTWWFVGKERKKVCSKGLIIHASKKIFQNSISQWMTPQFQTNHCFFKVNWWKVTGICSILARFITLPSIRVLKLTRYWRWRELRKNKCLNEDMIVAVVIATNRRHAFGLQRVFIFFFEHAHWGLVIGMHFAVYLIHTCDGNFVRHASCKIKHLFMSCCCFDLMS